MAVHDIDLLTPSPRPSLSALSSLKKKQERPSTRQCVHSFDISDGGGAVLTRGTCWNFGKETTERALTRNMTSLHNVTSENVHKGEWPCTLQDKKDLRGCASGLFRVLLVHIGALAPCIKTINSLHEPIIKKLMEPLFRTRRNSNKVLRKKSLQPTINRRPVNLTLPADRP